MMTMMLAMMTMITGSIAVLILETAKGRMAVIGVRAVV